MCLFFTKANATTPNPSCRKPSIYRIPARQKQQRYPQQAQAEAVERVDSVGLPEGVRAECADDEREPLIPTPAYPLTAARFPAAFPWD